MDFTIPDVFGRIVLTGLCENNVQSATINVQCILANYNNQNNNFYGYNVNFVLNNPEILLVNYYDTYDFIDYLGLTDLSFSEDDATIRPIPMPQDC